LTPIVRISARIVRLGDIRDGSGVSSCHATQ
jgi:hypothetical protein